MAIIGDYQVGKDSGFDCPKRRTCQNRIAEGAEWDDITAKLWVDIEMECEN